MTVGKTYQVEKQTVLVVGATGRTGAHLVQRLCNDDAFDVVILARDAAKASRLQETWPQRVRVIEGDLGDVDSWAANLCGVSQIVTAVSCGVRTFSDPLGVLGISEPPKNLPRLIDGEGMERLCEQASVHGVKRIVAVTSASTGTPWSAAGVFLNLIAAMSIKYKFEGEQAIRRSGLDYVILRPYGLQDTNPLGADSGLDISYSQGHTEGTRKRIARGDVAALCHEALGQPSGVRTTFECWTTPLSAAVDSGCRGEKLPWHQLNNEPPGSVADVDHNSAVMVGVGTVGITAVGLGKGLLSLVRRVRRR